MVEDIISVLPPILRKEWNDVACMALFLSQGSISCFLLVDYGARIPLLLDILLHVWVLGCILLLLEVFALAEYLTRQRNFLSIFIGIADLLWLELSVTLQE